MANNASPKKKAQNQRDGFAKLPFHSPKVSKADKGKILEKLGDNSMRLSHLDGIISESDWLKIRYDDDNGVWLIMHTYTPNGSDAPIGIITYRAKTVSKALALALWCFDEVSDSDFISDDEDGF